MNGLIHRVLADYAEARSLEVPADSAFEQHPDALTFARVGGVAEALGVEPAELLRDLGRSFPVLVGAHGYGSVLDALGPSFTAFLGQLDAMHAGLSVSFPGAMLPSFSLVEADEKRCLVAYRSSREGLVPFVEGILEGCARRFGLDVTVRVQCATPSGATIFEVERRGEGGNWR